MTEQEQKTIEQVQDHMATQGLIAELLQLRKRDALWPELVQSFRELYTLVEGNQWPEVERADVVLAKVVALEGKGTGNG